MECCDARFIMLVLRMQNMFKTGAVMVFISQASGKALRVLQNGDVDGRGTEDDALGMV